MSFPNGFPALQSTALHRTNSSRSLQHLDDGTGRTSTPIDNSVVSVPEPTLDAEEEARRAHFADLYRKTEDKVAILFGENGSYNHAAIEALKRRATLSSAHTNLPPTTDHEPIQEPPLKKAKRAIDEDDYDDEDDDEEDAPAPAPAPAKPTAISANPLLSPSKSGSSPVQSANSPAKLDKSKGPYDSQDKDKLGDDALKHHEEEQKATEEAARRSFHTIMYTLENDRTAMLEQQQLEDSEKQLQAEMDHSGNANGQQNANQGTLSSANLGASSLTLKHLIARIDMKRDQVRASDAELRVLMNEVRKNRSKWASEENVNQEELYEALEKVLTELKAHTEYSTPFLTRVNKRDAPDYYTCKSSYSWTFLNALC